MSIILSPTGFPWPTFRNMNRNSPPNISKSSALLKNTTTTSYSRSLQRKKSAPRIFWLPWMKSCWKDNSDHILKNGCSDASKFCPEATYPSTPKNKRTIFTKLTASSFMMKRPMQCSISPAHPEDLQYFLSVSIGDQNIRLTGQPGFILVNDPCCLIINNNLFQFDDIDGKKLLPFFKRSTISIRRETEKKFLESFAKPVIQKYRVHATGFNIIDQHLQPVPVLSLETTLAGMPVFMLRFKYQDKASYLANKKSELLVTLTHANESVEFQRLNRDYEFENRIISSLLETGLANLDSSSFLPFRVNKSENILLTYDLVSWLNFNIDELRKLGVEVSQSLPVNRYYLQKMDLRLKVTENISDWFDIHAVVQLEGIGDPVYPIPESYPYRPP